MLDLGIYIIIGALVGAKLLLLVVDFDHVRATTRGAALAGAVGRRVLRRPDPRGRRGASGTSGRHACRSGRRATCSRRASRSASRSAGSDALPPAAATAGRRRALGDHLHRSARGGERRHAARHPAAPDAAVRSRRGAADPGRAARHRAAGRAVRRPDVLALHAALRGLALHHRVLPRRPRGTVFGMSRRRSSSRSCSRRWPSSCWSGSPSAPETPHECAPNGRAGARPGRSLDCHASTRRADDYDGQRLDRFLVSVLAEHSRSQIQRLIKDGHVQVGGRAQAQANLPVQGGRQVGVDVPEPVDAGAARRRRCRSTSSTRTPTSSSSTSRPAWSCIPAAGHATGTLVNALLHHVDDLSGIGGELRPGIVHRLDRGTSGADGRRQERRARTRSSRGSFTIARSRRNTSRWCGASCRPGAGSTRRSAAIRSTGRRCRRARGAARDGGHAHRRAPSTLPGADARAGRDSHRPHPPDPRAPERDRPPHRRRRALRRRPPPRPGGPAAVSGWSARSCTRRGWSSHIPSTGDGSSSPPHCRPISQPCWTRFHCDARRR